jgi:hypothetical protein
MFNPFGSDQSDGKFCVAQFLNGCILFLIAPLVSPPILPQVTGYAALGAYTLTIFGPANLLGLAAAWGLSKCSRRGQLLLVFFAWVLAGVLSIGSDLGLTAAPERNGPFWFPLVWAVAASAAPMACLSVSVFLLPWHAAREATNSDHDPYFFFAPFYLGSLAGLIGYPLAMASLASTPLLSSKALHVLPMLCLAVTGALVLSALGWPAALFRREANHLPTPPSLRTERPTCFRYVCWMVLPGLAWTLVLGVTAHVSIEIGTLPLFWILPLALYESSLVVAFVRMTSTRPGLLGWAVLSLALLVWIMVWLLLLHLLGIPSGAAETGAITIGLICSIGSLMIPHPSTLPIQVVLCLITVPLLTCRLAELPFPSVGPWSEVSLLLATCSLSWWGCHGDLVKIRPAPDRLFSFFVCASIGMVLGSLFMMLVAPALWSSLTEFPLLLVLAVSVRAVVRWCLLPAKTESLPHSAHCTAT